MFRSAQHDSAIYEMSASTKPISCRDVIPWNFPGRFGAWNLVLPSSHSQAVLGIFLQPIPETIEFFSDLRLDSSEFCGIEFSILRPALREKVILDLWLRS